MIRVSFRPLGVWQGEETRSRRRGQFKASFSSTMDLIDRELRQLDAEAVVIQIDVGEDDIRLDGWPRSSARPQHPGVALSFESRYGPLRYATDRFGHWQENLRAIALGLEALRRVDRYGITKSGEQYTGWRQLTAGNGGPTSREQATRLIAEVADFDIGSVASDRDSQRRAYRVALSRAHPDHGGSTERLMHVREAGRLLGLTK